VDFHLRGGAVTAAARKIRARLLDMLRGANGGYEMSDPSSDDWCGVASLGIDTFARFVGAVRREFVPEDHYLRDDHTLDLYDDVDRLAKRLADLP
jgi:hypothetical protein